jgi:hypothetical protein
MWSLFGGRRRNANSTKENILFGSICVCVKGKPADKAALLCGPNVIIVIFTLLPTFQVRN